MNRTATVLAATVAAFLLAAAPAAADESWPVVTDPWTGEVVDCFNEPWEIEPGVWECTSKAEAAETGMDTVPEEPADVVVETPDPVEVDRAEAEWAEPEPEPVEVVEDNGGWGWSDAREAYSL